VETLGRSPAGASFRRGEYATVPRWTDADLWRAIRVCQHLAWAQSGRAGWYYGALGPYVGHFWALTLGLAPGDHGAWNDQVRAQWQGAGSV
jgi:hypothetical protein